MGFKELYQGDLARYKMKPDHWTKRFLYYFRKASFCNTKIIKYYYIFMYKYVSQKHGIEIPRKTQIGKGFYIGHPFNITINGDVILGKNINIHKGVTIGQENRGERKGVPILGDYIWIGVNSTIVGHVTIGDNVLIAPNTYVNCDVPSNSIVLGNPCRIINRSDATDGYINNTV